MLNYDPTVLNIDETVIDDPFEYMKPFIDQIKNINIRDFDYELFEKNINEMNDDDFEHFFQEYMIPVLQEIDDKYLLVDFNEFEVSNTDAKKVLLNEYIKFLMQELPYDIIFAHYINKPFNKLTEVDQWLAIHDISKDLSDIIDQQIITIKNTYNLINNEINTSKRVKNDYKSRAEKLASVINHTINTKEYFKEILNSTENSQLRDLILRYVENEFF